MTPKVVAAGLGPAGPDLMTRATIDAIQRVPHRYLRTARHPAAAAVPDAPSFDHVYDELPTFDAVYTAIVEELVTEAARHGEVLYLVPGSPAVAERTVELLRAVASEGRLTLEVLPALSFLDLAWARLGVDPLAAGVRVVDGRRFAVEAAGERGPLLVAQCDSRLVLSDVKLAATGEAVLLRHLGLPDEVVGPVAWDDLDRAFEPDHLTTLYLPSVGAPVAQELVRFVELVRTLREQCPWDREQTHESLSRHAIEEAYEVVEAINSGDPAHLEEELGDLLFQVVFHATLGAEEGEYTLADVARGVHDKLVSRHPHVFGDVAAETAGQVLANWEQLKKAEKGRESIMDGLPAALPALMLARKVQQKARSVGFDWPSAEPVYDKVAEELEEVRAEPVADEVGDLLFAVVNLARHLGIDAEMALHQATQKFVSRFRYVERAAAERGTELTDDLWEEAKARG